MNVRRIAAVAASGIAGVLFFARRRRLREDISWEEASKPGRVVDIDAYGVHYVEHGEGPAIVLVHGFGGSTYHYRRMIPSLARGHRVIAVDLKGFGYSERDANAGLSHTDQVRMLRALLDRLGVTRAVFVGHSMGGGVVQRFASTYPEIVEAAVVVASVTGEEPFTRSRLLLPRFLLRWMLPYIGGLTASRLIKASFYDQGYLTDEIRAEYMRPTRIKGSMDGLLAMMRDNASDSKLDVARVTMPVLIINGAQDRIVPLKSGRRIRERIPQAKLVVMEHAAHGLIDECAPEVSRAILDFLRDSGMSAQEGATPSASLAGAAEPMIR